MKSKTPAILSFLVVVCIATLAAVFLIGHRQSAPSDPATAVTVVDGTQFIEIRANGGYAPSTIAARAGLPTVLRVVTKGTYDCSAALSIPALHYRDTLPPTGSTEITVPPQQPGATVKGTCDMGMYGFAIRFS